MKVIIKIDEAYNKCIAERLLLQFEDNFKLSKIICVFGSGGDELSWQRKQSNRLEARVKFVFVSKKGRAVQRLLNEYFFAF